MTSSPAQQAQDALLSFSRTGRIEGRSCEGFHWLGESPMDTGYRVRVTLTVRHDAGSKAYRAELAVSEERYEGGHAAQRFGFGMPSRQLGEVAASRFNAKRCEAIYAATLQELRSNPAPLIELLQEESERS